MRIGQKQPVYTENMGEMRIPNAAEATEKLYFAQKALEAARELMQPLVALQLIVEDGIPDGMVLLTKTSAQRSPASHIRGSARNYTVGSSMFYERCLGKLEARGAVVTRERTLPFIGDELILQRGNAIVFNNEINLGLAVRASVDLVHDANGLITRTFVEETVPFFSEVPRDVHSEYDFALGQPIQIV